MKSIRWRSAIKSLFFILVGLLFWLLLFSLISCDIKKLFNRDRSDTTGVKKVQVDQKDTASAGSVLKKESTSKESFDWERFTQVFADNKDVKPSVTNVYPQPAQIIYERGSGTKEEASRSVDSAWKEEMRQMQMAMFDSTNRRLDKIESQKTSKFKGFGLMTWLMAVLIAIIVLPKLWKALGIKITVSR